MKIKLFAQIISISLVASLGISNIAIADFNQVKPDVLLGTNDMESGISIGNRVFDAVYEPKVIDEGDVTEEVSDRPEIAYEAYTADEPYIADEPCITDKSCIVDGIVDESYETDQSYAIKEPYLTEETYTTVDSYTSEEPYITEDPYNTQDSYTSEESYITEDPYNTEDSYTSEEPYITDTLVVSDDSGIIDKLYIPDKIEEPITEQILETEVASFDSQATIEGETYTPKEDTEIAESLSDTGNTIDQSDFLEKNNNEIQDYKDIIVSQSEQPSQVGDTFSTDFGVYQILTTGEDPTAMLIDKARRDLNGNFIYGDTSKPWTAQYRNVEYNVTEIGSNCRLTGISGTISIPEGVTYIHNGAFSKSAAKRIDLPSSLVHFDEDATLRNLELITVAKESNYYKIEDGALLTKDGTKLILYPALYQNDTYTSPESVLSVEEDAFYKNAYLKTIILTKVETIKDYAFYEMRSIETIVYPKTLTNLSLKFVTFNCFTLKQIIVEEGNPILYDDHGILFYKDGNEYMLVLYPASYSLDEYCIPFGVKSICSFAFNGIMQTKIIKVPATVNTIYSYAFEETQVPIEFILHFSSPLELSQSAFDRLARGSVLYVESDSIKNGFLIDFLTTYINESGGTKIDTDTPVIVDYEKAVSRIDNWYFSSNNKYYYDKNGNLTVGLHEIDQYTYFFDENHVMKTGFQNVKGKTYYFSIETGKMLTDYGFININGKLYYIKMDSSIYKEATLKDNNMLYYFNTDTGEIICDSLSHSYDTWIDIITATCSKEGSQSHTCLKCSHVETRTVKKTQHSFANWIILTAPTCTSQGIKIHTCLFCHTSEQQIMPVSSHLNGKWTIKTQPTCLASGRKVLSCTLCGKIIQWADIERISHKYGDWNIKQKATYERSGSKVRTCSVCGTSDRAKIPKLLRKNIAKAVAYPIKQKIYNGKPQKPLTKLILNNKILKPNIDYNISYKRNCKPGKAIITIKGKRNYYGTKKLSFIILPKAPNIRSLHSSRRKTLSIKIKEAYYSNGYQIHYSTNKTFKNYKAINFSGISKTIPKLSSKKKYYIKIRSYTNISGKKIYGPFSKATPVFIK